MTHRAEQIMAQVRTLVTGLTTTGTNVKRSRHYQLPEGVAAGLFLSVGDDENREEQTQNDILSQIDISIDAVVAQPNEDTETTLHLIRAEVNVALAADYRIGLAGIVRRAWELGASAPIDEGEGSQAISRMRLHWRALYQRKRDDPAN